MGIQAGKQTLKKLVIVAAPLLLAGCGGPIELTVAKLAGDLISYVTTGKSTTDHVVSALADEDCALHRPLIHQDVCHANASKAATIVASAKLADPALGHADPIKTRIAGATQAVYAVNAPAEDWSDPRTPSAANSAAVMTVAMPSRPDPGAPAKMTATKAKAETPAVYKAPKKTAIAQKSQAQKNIEVASIDPFEAPGRAPDSTPIAEPEITSKDIQAEADAAMSGYVTAPSTSQDGPETRTAALTNEGVVSDLPSVGAMSAASNQAAGMPHAPLPGQYVVLASFRDEKRARNALTMYDAYHPQLIRAEVAGNAYIRVAVGPLSKSDASDLRFLAAKKGIKDSWIVGFEGHGE